MLHEKTDIDVGLAFTNRCYSVCIYANQEMHNLDSKICFDIYYRVSTDIIVRKYMLADHCISYFYHSVGHSISATRYRIIFVVKC